MLNGESVQPRSSLSATYSLCRRFLAAVQLSILSTRREQRVCGLTKISEGLLRVAGIEAFDGGEDLSQVGGVKLSALAGANEVASDESGVDIEAVELVCAS